MRLCEVAISCLDSDTSLFELVMRYPHTNVIRITDRLPEVGETLETRGEAWDVVRLECLTDDLTSTARFLCELRRNRCERAKKGRAGGKKRKSRLATRD
jgi:hypothetical protein